MHRLLLGFATFCVAGFAALPAESAVTATLAGPTLQIRGDGASDSITLRLVSGDSTRVQVLSGAVILGSFPRGSFALITIEAGGGDDIVTIDDANGVFTTTEITAIDGGSGQDQLHGGAGAETILGGTGHDLIWGEGGNDVIRGGDGDDQSIWTSGDGNDTFDGDAGTDRLVVGGSAAADHVSLSPAGARAVLTIDGGLVTLDVGTTEALSAALGEGADTFTTSPGVQTLTTLNVNGENGSDIIVGGDGDDTIHGGDGSDDLDGGAGSDSILPGPGNDVVRGGGGSDRVTCNGGDGNDSIEGGDGVDTYVMNGSSAAEAIGVSIVAGHVRVTRDIGSMQHELFTVERIQIYAAAGADIVSVAPGLDAMLEHTWVDLGGGSDTAWSSASSGQVIFDGRPGDLDTLNFDAESQILNVQPYHVRIGDSILTTFFDMESLRFTNTVGTLPTVTITSPTTASSTAATSSFVAVGGTASDPEGLDRVTWTTMGGRYGAATGTTAWTVPEVPVHGGLNAFIVTAIDAAGNQVTDRIEITVSSVAYVLAEGATGGFFDLDVSIANPNYTATNATVTFLTEDGTTIDQDVTLEARTHRTLHVDAIPGLENAGGVSTVVRSPSGNALVVERTMFWDASHYGSHGGAAVAGPRTRWLFAEGSEGFFHTFVLLANAGPSPSLVTLTFLREGSTPFVRTLTVPPTSRVTVAANASPELVNRSFSIVVDASTPIVAERAMYFGTARLFDGGHESAGVPEGARSWFLAEGATGPFFETFILVGNPNPAPATLTVTFLTDGGVTVVRHKTVAANGRLTINIETEDPLLRNAAVATSVTADQPIVVERAMYWPGPPSTWAEAHNSFGTTALAVKWGVAEGRVGMAEGFQTYLLLANPNPVHAMGQITFMRASGPPIVKSFVVNPTSRLNIAVNAAVPELADETFGALIEVSGNVPISVERATYSNALGQIWAAGTNTPATQVP